MKDVKNIISVTTSGAAAFLCGKPCGTTLLSDRIKKNLDHLFIYSYGHLTFGGYEPNWTFAASNQCGLLRKKFCSDQKIEFVVLS